MNLIVLILSFNQYFGQNYRIDYQMSYKPDSLQSDFKTKNMVLLLKENKSKFLSLDQYKNDSLFIIKNKENKYFVKNFDFKFMTICDYSNKKVYRFTSILRDLYRTTSDIPSFNWEINSETKKILGFNCQNATLSYSNRKWEVWFTTDIPIQSGPYIFSGLPGLIVEMKDTKNNYTFNLLSITRGDNFNIDFIPTKFLDITNIQLAKLKLDYYNDPYREMKSGQIKVRWQDENGVEFKPNYGELTKSEQDYIRKNNNEIELSEAIKYK
ncbi:GLPGLI family protein [Bergeyella sp. RCAD1439]|uniref:GLPGLI family protein n=1 Tax=Bergeyella anatis TaxID=3113737 RepID=UPI002E196D76|nr:GLPGLI family protein [Bergeyella sp. RCAD1439]